MESLMENPMRAVLYLKELTTIVQNQQTLILTQRHRIHELELKVEELLQENQSLKDEPGESGHRQQQQRELPEPETEPELQPDPDSHRHKHQHHPQHKAQAISNSRAAIHCHPADIEVNCRSPTEQLRCSNSTRTGKHHHTSRT